MKKIFLIILCFLLSCSKEFVIEINDLPLPFKYDKLLNNNFIILEVFHYNSVGAYKVFKRNAKFVLYDYDFKGDLFFISNLHYCRRNTFEGISGITIRFTNDSTFYKVKSIIPNGRKINGNKSSIDVYMNENEKSLFFQNDSIILIEGSKFPNKLIQNDSEYVSLRVWIPNKKYHILEIFSHSQNKRSLYKLLNGRKKEFYVFQPGFVYMPYVIPDDTLIFDRHKNTVWPDSSIRFSFSDIDTISMEN